MTLVRTDAEPLTLAGFPLRSWAFGLRIWAAMVVALYAAFWLQLEGASSAAVCVGILALPTRGQAYQKAVYRFLGTVIAVAVSIVIMGLLAQARDLFILAVAGWLGLCVVAAGFLDGNRAYGALLSGYTVALVAFPQLDAPQGSFLAGVNRGAAILVGIAALTLINDVFAAPDVHTGLAARLADVRGRTRAFSLAALRNGRADPVEAAVLLKDIAAFHPDVTALSVESASGQARGAAAGSAAAALVTEIHAARALVSLKGADHPIRRDLAGLLSGGGAEDQAFLDRLGRAAWADGHDRVLLARLAADLLDQDRLANREIAALRSGHDPARRLRLPIYRSGRAAARNGLRIFLVVALAAIPIVLSGWPSASLALAVLGSTAALSATNPSPRAFAQGALVAMPLAAALAGIVEFLVLDGVDQFPLLAIAMGPPIVGASLLLTQPNPRLFGIGFLLLVFFPVLLSPANPQSYDPQTYLYTSILAITAVVALFVTLSTILPTSDALRRRWFLRSAEADVREALSGRARPRPEAEAAFRDADRIGQLAGLQADPPQREADIRHILRLADLAAAARRAWSALRGLTGIADAGPAMAEARAALAAGSTTRLRHASAMLSAADEGGSGSGRSAAHGAAADLARLADLLDTAGAEGADGGRRP